LEPDETMDDVVGDAGRLRQVVWNLLSNAVKFTPDGGRVIVTLAAAPHGQIELRVCDNGIGIDPTFLPHVFERFRQADSSSTRAHGGLGLGLAIVRHLVELHGGSVEVASDGPGAGATFTVRLTSNPDAQHPKLKARAASAEAPARNVGDDLEARPNLSGLHVLLVEDEADAREAFSSMLELCGAEVRAVASASDALAAFRARRPDVLLSDIGMAGEDGYTLIRQVRALEGPPKAGRRPIPAMAITAFAGAEDRVRAIRAGFQVHVPKPIGSAQFTAAVAALARRHAPPAPAAQSAAGPVPLDIPARPPLSPPAVPL
jgi:CheY-like chemotaxis protein